MWDEIKEVIGCPVLIPDAWVYHASNYQAMPLASVEEWRARVGSCWCALGRPFKTSIKSSGDYRSFAAVSGSAMLQAVYALMAMVLALTRDTTVVFIRGAESVNGCVNECQRLIKSEL